MIRVFTSHIIGRIHFSTYPSCNILVVCYHFTVWKFKFPFLCVSLFVTLQSYYHYTVFKVLNKNGGGLKWNRTIDLTLIRRAL